MSAINGFITHIDSAETTHYFIDTLSKNDALGGDGVVLALDDQVLQEYTSAEEAATKLVENIKLVKFSKVGLAMNAKATKETSSNIVRISDATGKGTVFMQNGRDELNLRGWDGSTEGLIEILKQHESPFSMAMIDSEHPSRLYLARTSMPLHIMYNGSTIFFSSTPITNPDESASITGHGAIPNLEPYTLTVIDVHQRDGITINSYSLWRDQEPKKALVLLAKNDMLATDVCARVMKRAGYEVSILAMSHPCPLELSDFSVEYHDICLVGLDESIGQTTILSLAVEHTAKNHHDLLVLPYNAEWEDRKPENSFETINRFVDMLPHITPHQCRVGVVTPLYNLTQKKIEELKENITKEETNS